VNASIALLCLGVAVGLIACTQTASAQLAPEKMNGIWEGSVSIVGVAPESARAGFQIGDITPLRVTVSPDGTVTLVSADSPQLRTMRAQRMANTVTILAVVEANCQAEHWALTVALQDERTLVAALSRGVRQVQSSESADVFTVGALGQLRQVDDN
jgi:hypothetical protein